MSLKIADIQNFFTAADSNHNGYLTSKELKRAISSQVTGVQQYLTTFLNDKGKIDSAKFNMACGGDGKFTVEELVALFTETDEEDNVKIIDDDTFDARFSAIGNLSSIDKDKNGRLSDSEIVKAYNNAPEGSELKQLLANFVTTNKKGKVIADKAKIRVLSGGKKYLTREDLLKTDTDRSKSASTDEVSTYLDKASGFTALDLNGDGKLTSKEILKLYNDASTSNEVKAFLANFVSQNAKGKNVIDKAKLRAVGGGNKYLTYSDFLKSDKDADGKSAPEEMKEYLSTMTEFTTLDLNGDGKVTLSEMKKYVKKGGGNSELAKYISSLVSNKEMKRVFKILSGSKSYLTTADIAKYDTDGNGVICTGELANFKRNANGITLP